MIQDFSLNDNTFIILRDLIHEQTGLYYESHKKDLLADKLIPRLNETGSSSFLDYYYLLKYDSMAFLEWKVVRDVLAVPETFFWREVDQIKLLVNDLIPHYLEQVFPPISHNNPLRIWSAACSTGEEPLSIAIALQEAGWFHRIPIEIYASDASLKAIRQAEKGFYRDRSFRTLPQDLKDRYFTLEDNTHRISPQIHRKIHWQTANLMIRSEIEYLAKAHFIFCRNVFIYFSEQSIKKVVNLFYEKMPPLSYLFISCSESLLKLKTNFQLREINGAFVYEKKTYNDKQY